MESRVPSYRVCVVGAGPAGFYAAAHLLKQRELPCTVDVLDRLPTPYGLVRTGVAPDHASIRQVTRVFDRTARHPAFRFFGNVTFGRDVFLDDLQAHYHAVILCTGACADRMMGVPGEELEGSYAATDFVYWYNGHPDYAHRSFALNGNTAVVIGIGNVAVDVARMLGRMPFELEQTDVAQPALNALSSHGLRSVWMFGRRGPLQAAFTLPELLELTDMPGTSLHTDARDLALGPKGAEPESRDQERILDILHAHTDTPPKARQLHLRFGYSPTRLHGTTHVSGIHLVRNRLEADGSRIRAVATDETLHLVTNVVIRAVGYRCLPMPDLPYCERVERVPQAAGRVLDAPGGAPLPGMYAAGWVKRGPSGVIGTNKQDAAETVASVLEDLRHARPDDKPSPDATERFLRSRQPRVVTFADWERIDAHEIAEGEAHGRPRMKLTDLEAMLDIALNDV